MAEEEQSLITDEHRARVGVRGEPFTVTVNEEDARRMRDVLGDSDPRWADGTGMAPPYVLAMFSGGRSHRPDMIRVLPGGLLTQQEWKFSRPFRIGETLTGYNQLVDVRERLGGRYGHSVLVTNGTDFLDADGNHVASVMMTITQFDPARAESNS